MVKFPKKFIKTNEPAGKRGEKHLELEDVPAGRALQNGHSTVQPVLTANMTGQVTLAGEVFDLQFNKGHLRAITDRNKKSGLYICSRSYFQTTKGRFDYRNESAFALDSESEYGLRSMQTGRRNKDTHRIITDFFFSRETGGCYITISIEYPEFPKDEIIEVSAPVELRLRLDDNETEIKSEAERNPVSYSRIMDKSLIKGSSFDIYAGEGVLELSYVNEYRSRKFSKINGMAVRLETGHRKKYLLLNPGGSYQSAPAEYYSKVREQFCIRLDFKKRNLKTP